MLAAVWLIALTAAGQAGLEDELKAALAQGNLEAAAQLSSKWANEFGPNLVAQLEAAAKAALDADRAGQAAAADKRWARVRELVQRIPEMPGAWVAATFAHMCACYGLGRLSEGFAYRDALRAVGYHNPELLQPVVRWAEELSRRWPRSARAFWALGLAQAVCGDYDAAVASCSKAIALKPDFAAAFCTRGDAYASKGQYERAIGDFARAIELSPRQAWPYCGRGLVYVRQRRFPQAVADYDRAIELDAQLAWAYFRRGEAYVLQSQRDKAEADLDRAIQLRPTCADAYAALGALYGDSGRVDKAIAYLQRAVWLQPECAKSNVLLAVACREGMNRNPQRREEYRKMAIAALRTFIRVAPGQGLEHVVPAARGLLQQLEGGAGGPDLNTP